MHKYRVTKKIFLPGFLLILVLLFPAFVQGSQKEFTEHIITILEASGIVALNNREFLVVDDEDGVYFLDRHMNASLLLSAYQHKRLDDLEGITISDDQQTIYLLSEKTGSVFTSSLETSSGSVSLQPPEFLGSLPQIGTKANKGWEGICLGNFDGQNGLLAIHQEKPRAIGFFRLSDLKKLWMHKLPEELKKLLKNLSDVTINPINNHIFLLSGKSGMIVEISIDRGPGLAAISIVSTTKIQGNLTGRPEGLCFTPAGQIVFVTDGAGQPGNLVKISNP